MSVLDAKWTQRFIELATLASTWSKDPSTKVGAVIVDHTCRVISLGYNGFPRGVSDDPIRYENKNVKYAMIVHSEVNAILNASRSVREMVMITTKYPCTECVKLIIQSGILEVHSPEPTPGRWADDAMIARQMLMEAGVEHRVLAASPISEIASLRNENVELRRQITSLTSDISSAASCLEKT